MERNAYTVVGKYRDPVEVKATLQRLERDGYAKRDISLYSNRSNYDQFEETMGVDMHVTDDDRSFWDEVKDMFTMDDDRETDASLHEDFLTPYREDIDNGYTVIAVRNYTDNLTAETDTTDVNTTGIDRDMTADETIQLKEERLHVDKEEVQTGEVHVTKKTVHDTETIEVPVEREEIVVERRSVQDGEVDIMDGDFDEETESITIPVKEEKVTVDKDTVVTEEVEIKKEHETDVEHVTEDVRREEIDIEASGNVHRQEVNLDDDSLDKNRADLDSRDRI